MCQDKLHTLHILYRNADGAVVVKVENRSVVLAQPPAYVREDLSAENQMRVIEEGEFYPPKKGDVTGFSDWGALIRHISKHGPPVSSGSIRSAREFVINEMPTSWIETYVETVVDEAGAMDKRDQNFERRRKSIETLQSFLEARKDARLIETLSDLTTSIKERLKEIEQPLCHKERKKIKGYGKMSDIEPK